MSSLQSRALGPALIRRSVASSNLENSQENWSFDMSSLMDEPWGWDRSIISLTEPSFLGVAPMGEQWVWGKGGYGKGPAVWPRLTSLLMAAPMAVLFWSADLRFFGSVCDNGPVNPMSNPLRSPSTMYVTKY